MTAVDVVIQHTSGQFSDSPAAHAADAEAIFDHAVSVGAWVCTGTEASAREANHDLRDLLSAAARRHRFRMLANPAGEWVALNLRFLRHLDHGFAGPLIPATHGLPASHGGHGPRGIAWAQVRAIGHDLGVITVGSTHWLTRRSIAATGADNLAMVRGAAQFGAVHGRGRRLAFLAGDANERDDLRDLFAAAATGADTPAGFVTIADQLGRHPATHDGGSPIDFIAAWSADKRVTANGYRVLGDTELPLRSDHFCLLATYAVQPLGKRR